MQLQYTRDELLAEHDFAQRTTRGDTVYHGGLDAAGTYVSPRSLHRISAIQAWVSQLEAAGQPARVMEPQQFVAEFFPNADQSCLLLRHGARSSMTRILTLVGLIEGFGNDGIRAMPKPPLQPYFKEPLDDTCLGHLYLGLLDAHGMDEAGGPEAGHDAMWFAIRDAALDNPPVTPDMYENLPISPPPGYEGPAKADPEALGPTSQGFESFFPTLNPMVEIVLRGLAQILVIECGAYNTFNWARHVLSQPDCSAEPEWAPRMVDYIQADEQIHVDYLNCALGEARCRTLIDQDGNELSGREVVDTIVTRARERGIGGGRDRIRNHRMKQIRRELESLPDGEAILAEFARLGEVPAIA